MISSYRLGDLFAFGDQIGERAIQDLIREHPDSIGKEYYLSKKKKTECIETMIDIVMKKLSQCSHLLPDDIENSTVIHVRLGDVVSGTEVHEKGKRPLSVEHLVNVTPLNKKTYVIGKCFFANTSSKNYSVSIKSSQNYLNEVLQKLNSIHFDGGNADIDLCCAVKCELFIQGKGYFSKLIADIRKKLNKETIPTSECS